MNFMQIFVMCLQMAVVAIGYPLQIQKNYLANSNGEATTKLGLIFMVFSSRMVLTYTDSVWYIFVPDTIAVIMIGITLLQIKNPRNYPAKIITTIVNLFTKKQKYDT